MWTAVPDRDNPPFMKLLKGGRDSAGDCVYVGRRGVELGRKDEV